MNLEICNFTSLSNVYYEAEHQYYFNDSASALQNE